jgi:hypothetical protein
MDGQPNDTRLVGLACVRSHSPAPVCTALMIFADNIIQLLAHCSFWCLRPSKHDGVLGHNSNIYSLVTVEEAAALGVCCTLLRVCLCIIPSYHRNHLIVIERRKIIPTKELHKVSITSAQIQKLQNANSSLRENYATCGNRRMLASAQVTAQHAIISEQLLIASEGGRLCLPEVAPCLRSYLHQGAYTSWRRGRGLCLYTGVAHPYLSCLEHRWPHP